MDCCKNTVQGNLIFILHFFLTIIQTYTIFFSKDDDCSSHFCPNGQSCENTRNGPVCRCPPGYEKDSRTGACVGKNI